MKVFNLYLKTNYQLLLPTLGPAIPPPGELKDPGGAAGPTLPLLSVFAPPAVTTALPCMLVASELILPFDDPITGEFPYADASLKSSIDVPNISFFNSDEYTRRE